MVSHRHQIRSIQYLPLAIRSPSALVSPTLMKTSLQVRSLPAGPLPKLLTGVSAGAGISAVVRRSQRTPQTLSIQNGQQLRALLSLSYLQSQMTSGIAAKVLLLRFQIFKVTWHRGLLFIQQQATSPLSLCCLEVITRPMRLHDRLSILILGVGRLQMAPIWQMWEPIQTSVVLDVKIILPTTKVIKHILIKQGSRLFPILSASRLG